MYFHISYKILGGLLFGYALRSRKKSVFLEIFMLLFLEVSTCDDTEVHYNMKNPSLNPARLLQLHPQLKLVLNMSMFSY